MFCPECQGHFLHEYECGLNFCGDSDFNSIIMEMVRSILLTVKKIPTVDELMSFVEQMLMTKELPESMFDDRSKFQAFFNFPLKKHDMSLVEMKKHIYPVYKTLLRIPHVNEMFRTKKHQRFLMHLIGHHKMLPEIGAGTECHKGLQGRSGASVSVRISPVMLSYFTHSCRSNVLNFTNGGKIILYSSRLIKNGEQLTIPLAPRGVESTKKRKQILLDVYRIKCECSRCQGKTASPAQRHQLVSDPAYCYIKSNMENLYPLQFNSVQFKLFMDACMTVLQRYGQMDWSDEFENVSQMYRNMYQMQLRSGGRDFNHPLFRAIFLHFFDHIKDV